MLEVQHTREDGEVAAHKDNAKALVPKEALSPSLEKESPLKFAGTGFCTLAKKVILDQRICMTVVSAG
jgi:hypothetical protein